MTELISLALNLIFGGGSLIWFITIRSQRKKAGAEAKGAEATAESTELDNVEKAIKIWREMAENLKIQRDEALNGFSDMSKQVEALRRDVKKLNCTNQKILRLLDKISHENLERTVEEIKSEIQHGEE
jgi:predicted RNase H-like nuclease (RuvC/YqgF family)